MISAKNEKTMGEEKVMDRKMTEKEFENRCMDVIESIASLDIGQEKQKIPIIKQSSGFSILRGSRIYFSRAWINHASEKYCFVPIASEKQHTDAVFPCSQITGPENFDGCFENYL